MEWLYKAAIIIAILLALKVIIFGSSERCGSGIGEKPKTSPPEGRGA